MALGFAVGARGADHNRSGAYEVDFSDKVDRRHVTLDAVRHAIETEDKAALMDSLILCKFLRGVFDDFYAESAAMLRRVTGWDVTGDELRETARRIVAAKREFNLRAGWTPAEDTLPERFLKTPLPNDPEASLSRERLDALVGRIPPPARLVGCQAQPDVARPEPPKARVAQRRFVVFARVQIAQRAQVRIDHAHLRPATRDACARRRTGTPAAGDPAPAATRRAAAPTRR